MSRQWKEPNRELPGWEYPGLKRDPGWPRRKVVGEKVKGPVGVPDVVRRLVMEFPDGVERECRFVRMDGKWICTSAPQGFEWMLGIKRPERLRDWLIQQGCEWWWRR